MRQVSHQASRFVAKSRTSEIDPLKFALNKNRNISNMYLLYVHSHRAPSRFRQIQPTQDPQRNLEFCIRLGQTPKHVLRNNRHQINFKNKYLGVSPIQLAQHQIRHQGSKKSMLCTQSTAFERYLDLLLLLRVLFVAALHANESFHVLEVVAEND